MSETRWPERYGPDWTPDEFNSLAGDPRNPIEGGGTLIANPAHLANNAAELTAEFEEGIELEAIVYGNGLILRGPYIDDHLMGDEEADV